MKLHTTLAVFAVVCAVTLKCVAAIPTHLTCEYRENPVGVESENPRLSWWLPEGSRTQKAYRIVVDGLWDSGWVESDQSVNIPYGGKSVDDLSRVTWRVSVKTDIGESGWSEDAHWTQGKRSWKAKWIKSKPHVEKVPDDRYVIRIKGDKVYTLEVNGKKAYRTFARSDSNRFDFWRYADITEYVKNDGSDVFEATEGTVWERVTETPSHGAPAFRKRFSASKEIKRAVLAICGLGYYEASLDGNRIGAKRLDPIPTNYDKRVYYSVYELGGLAAGQHDLDVLLGHGWYDAYASAVWSWDGAPWRDDPKLLAELRLEYADGTCETIATDETWRRVGNPVWYDNVREGEVIGPRPDIDEPAILADAPKGTLAAETQPGSVIAREIAPQKIKPLGGGDYLVDFGENIAGWMRMKMRGLAKGDVIHVRYDERVNDGFVPCTTNRIITWHFRYSNSWAFPGKGGFQIDRYIASGDGEETYEPRFTYNGFRYVLIEGLKSAPTAEDLRACVIHTGFKTAGSFDCSDKDFLDILKMADRAYRGNFANGFPTDCPHREKNGWTGDANLAAELAQYSYENTAAYEGWCVELRDAQREDGHMPGICPTAGWGYGGYGPVWDSVLTALPANLRKYRGDTRITELLKDAQKKYVEYYSTNPLFSTNGIIYYGYGDWCPAKTYTTPAITSTGYFIAACEEVGRGDLAAKYRKASVGNFYKGDGVWQEGSQTAQACALNFKLYDGEEMRKATVEKLVKSVHDADDHIDFGLVGSKQVFRALSEAGYTALAYKMATQRDYPSFLYWRDNGGTTFMEEWKLSAPSQNHVMFADIVAWSYQYLAGIREVEDGFKTFTLAPDVIPQLNYVSASVETPYGVVKSAWRRDGEKVIYRFTVPPGTSAKVRLAGVNKTFGPGSHEVSSSR